MKKKKKKEKVNHSDAQRERFPLLCWWPVSTSPPLNQAFSSSKGTDFRQQPNEDHGVGHEPWRSSQISSETNEFESRRLLTAAAPHRSRHYDRLWFTGVKHVTLSQGEMTHMETLLSLHYENPTSKKKTRRVWTMTKGKWTLAGTCTHILQKPYSVATDMCVTCKMRLLTFTVQLPCRRLTCYLFENLQTYKPADSCTETHEGMHLPPPMLRLCRGFFFHFFSWQPLNVEQHKTGPRQSTVDVCFLIRCISLKNGGLCWTQAVPHVVYQATLASLDVCALNALKPSSLFRYRAAHYAH